MSPGKYGSAAVSEKGRTVENLGRIISEHPFCRGLEKEYVELLISCASNVRFEEGFYLFREGGEANEFYLIRGGKIGLEVSAPPRPSLTVETVQEGDVLGWSWLVPPYRWRFGARALEPVRAIAVDGKCLRGKCEKNAQLGYELLRRTVEIMGQRLEATRFRLVDLYSAAETPRKDKRSSGE
jgi:CRP/FNR family transcriptional regulator, cyclic AMP receptor protein